MGAPSGVKGNEAGNAIFVSFARHAQAARETFGGSSASSFL